MIASEQTGPGTVDASPDRIRVLILAEYYLPGVHGGGPIRTLASLVESLGEQFEFSVITRDRDLGATQPYAGVRVGEWTPVGLARVLYCSPAQSGFGAMLERLRETPFDVLYLNSCWSPRYSLQPLLMKRLSLLRPDRPVVLASRGEFAPGALAVKRTKKRVFLLVARLCGLYRRLTWQASSPIEAAQIRSVIAAAHDVRVAPNPTPRLAASDAPRDPKPADRLRVVWLGRIASNKNLLGALESLRHVRGRIRYDVYGPPEDADYWARCQREIGTLASNVEVIHHGSVSPDRIPEIMRTHDLLFLPTHGENFGQAIFEALAGGCPVLISDRTPWQDLEARHAGWVLPVDDVRGFARVLDLCAAMSPDAHAEWAAGARAMARAVAEDEAILASNVALFRSVAGRDGAGGRVA